MLVGLLWNLWSFLILITIIHFGCWYEFVKLMKKIYGARYFSYCLLGLIYITIPLFLFADMSVYLRIADTAFEKTHSAYPWAFLIYAPLIPCAIIFSIWINDTMAY